MFSNFIFCFFLFCLLNFLDATLVEVKGLVQCNNESIFNATVELWEKDFDPDDFLNRTSTAEDGAFEISGEQSEVLGIDPYLYILHSCSAEGKKNCTYRNAITLDNAVQNGLIKLEDFLVNFGIGGEKPANENCPENPSDEILAQELAAENSTSTASTPLDQPPTSATLNGTEKGFEIAEMPDGMAADLEQEAGLNDGNGTNGNGTTLEASTASTTVPAAAEDEADGPAFNLTISEGEEKPENSSKVQQVY